MKNLLIITSRYPHKHDSISGSFVKSQVDELKAYFERVVVISIIPYTPKLLARCLNPKRIRDSKAQDYKYDNIEVYYTKNLVLPFEFHKKKRGQKGLKSTEAILEKIKFKPEIIHAHYTWPSGYVSMKLKEILSVPYFITAHRYDIQELPFRNSYYLNTVKKILLNSNKIIAVSHKNKEILTDKLDVQAEKIEMIPNGYNPKIFRPLDVNDSRDKLNLPKDKYIVFSLGQLVERKGFQDLIDGAKKLSEKRSDFIICIGGEGPLKKQLEEKIKKNGLTNIVRLIGFVPGIDIPLWINAANFFVLPSYSEGNPTVMFEVIGCGRPFVGTSVGGIPEIINDDSLGILFSSGDINSLVASISKATDIEWDYNFIINNAKQYTWQNIAKQIMVIYMDEERNKHNT